VKINRLDFGNFPNKKFAKYSSQIEVSLKDGKNGNWVGFRARVRISDTLTLTLALL